MGRFGALRARAQDTKIIDAVLDRVTSKHEADLLLITATWSAATDRDTGAIRIQRTKTGHGDDADRDQLWGKFYTLIHEYCHSLAHPRWYAYVDAKGATDKQASHALLEGVTELLTRTVLSMTNVGDDKLRHQVEGGLYDKESEPPEPDRGYGPAFQRAEALVGVIGIHNLYAAYFLGQTELAGA
jgi:hypothetical protein